MQIFMLCYVHSLLGMNGDSLFISCSLFVNNGCRFLYCVMFTLYWECMEIVLLFCVHALLIMVVDIHVVLCLFFIGNEC